MAKRYNFLTRCLAAVALLFVYVVSSGAILVGATTTQAQAWRGRGGGGFYRRRRLLSRSRLRLIAATTRRAPTTAPARSMARVATGAIAGAARSAATDQQPPGLNCVSGASDIRRA